MKHRSVTNGQKKIKVLAYCDAPVCATGFGTVSRNILMGLHNTGRYEIEVLGINYWGDPFDMPMKIWPVGTNKERDPYGRKKICGMIPQMLEEDTILFFLQDTFILDFLPELINGLRAQGKNNKSIVYIPIDGVPKEQWVHNVNACDHLIAYSKFGEGEMKKACPGVKPIQVISHGVNTSDYFVVNKDEVTSFRKQYFGSVADKFIFTNVNRNQQRKDIPRTIAAFAEFRKEVKDSILYLHMAQKDQGWDLPEVVKSYGLNTTTDVIFPQHFGPNQGYPRNIVNLIYNASDCVVSTSLGEGFGMCVHPETRVYIENGTKCMAELTVSDKVLSSNGNYNNVEAIMTKDHDGDLYEITTWMSNIPIKTSPEHGFLVKTSNNKYNWKKVSNLSVGDSLVFPKNGKSTVDTINVFELIRPHLNIRQLNNIVETETHFKIQSNFKKEGKFVPKQLEITEDLMYLFGLYLAEGCVGTSKMDSIMFSFHKEEKNLMFFVENFMLSVFGLSCKYADHTYRGPDYKGQTITFYSSVVAQLFKALFGLGARNKYIHRILLGQPNNMLQKLLYGEFLGDGSYGKTTYELSFSTTSTHLAYALRLIMAKMGIISSVRTSRVEYKINVSGTSKRKLLNMFNIQYDVNRKWENGTDRASQDHNYLLLPIKNITISKYKGKLIDIQVANTNDFVAENVVVHNSWIESMATKTPVIIPNNTMMSEFIDEDNGYLVKSGTNPSLYTTLPNDNEVCRPLVDVEDMVEKMLDVYNNPEEAKRRAENAYNWVTMKMDWQKNIVPQWIELFDKVYKESQSGNTDVVESDKILTTEKF